MPPRAYLVPLPLFSSNTSNESTWASFFTENFNYKKCTTRRISVDNEILELSEITSVRRRVINKTRIPATGGGPKKSVDKTCPKAKEKVGVSSTEHSSKGYRSSRSRTPPSKLWSTLNKTLELILGPISTYLLPRTKKFPALNF